MMVRAQANYQDHRSQHKQPRHDQPAGTHIATRDFSRPKNLARDFTCPGSGTVLIGSLRLLGRVGQRRLRVLSGSAGGK
jgi:hypothetical protein